ncbi:4-carboxy-4-hydroxy-2-oxoadipate aldolase/oxaloacetate decarboxylase [Kineosporia sp. J2-2]|uniref:Putative 4-hydroxy-4-methyl-2-oxoglutarate aldolase n=1 Tax=Kineosporia corallincola TaxID=2835133 RepID=A0ABS5TBQ8_9ACTN|nr:4-carboxy-4-hydroxy-2-oxoadipate aldolase/oxaloacetate decarboxylase [Kineosporia corallincola]MBT0768278.1 4-carboxy-4-hydroxy-2-oxoadipate aldolase/oxaloacetate decarboxylase [Kineosporia corallincola]
MSGPGVYEQLAALGVATVYEAAGRRGLIDVDLEQLLPGTSVAGPARIAACAQDDNWAVHKVMPAVRPGEVLVLTMPEPRPVALVGDLLLTQARVAGAAGVLVDASTRDVADVRDLGLPVWTRWRRVRGAVKDTPGEIDVPVTVGGQRIEPGDVVLMDADGACVVPAARVAQVLEAALARQAREAAARARYADGEFSYDVNGLREREDRL